MKKLILIIAIALCLATICGVFALAVFDSSPISGTISPDDFLFLELNSEFTSNLELVKDVPIIKAISLRIRSSNSVNAYLKINASSSSGKSLSNVTFSLYSDSSCENLLKDKNGNDCIISGDGNMVFATLNNTDTIITVYLKIKLNDDITETQFDNIGGRLTISLSENA